MTNSGAPIRIIFLGTPDFALPTLSLLSAPYSLVGIITQPDRPVGRRQTLTPSPVKVAAKKLGIPVLQPEKLRDKKIVEQIRELKPDLIVVAAYGQIIPKAVLEIPRYGALNIHPSLLPKYRGASPIQAAIAAGDIETGVTLILLDEELDHGPILAQARVPIAPDETGSSLSPKLARIGAELLRATMPEWITKKIKPQEQDHTQATVTKLLTRDDGKIDWHEPAEVIDRRIRAYDPWPGTWTTIQIKDSRFKIKVLKAHLLQLKSYNLNLPAKPGTVFKTPSGFAIACGQTPSPSRGKGWGEGVNALEILELQPEGKRAMSAAEFLRGHPDVIGATMSS